MADVVVTVMIDGKQAFVAGAGNTPAPTECTIEALQFGVKHFLAIRAAAIPQVSTAAKPQDNSL